MKSFKFEDGEYLCILGWDGGSTGDYECYSCNSKEEVFQVLTRRIKEEIEFHFEYADNTFDLYSQPEEINAYVDMINATDVLRNPSIIKHCYDTFFSDAWWFKVIDSYGEIWFEQERY